MTRRKYQFFVYIMASKSGTLYTGVTNGLKARVIRYKEGKIDGFSKRYGCIRLVYCEQYQYILNAIAREKEMKNYIREKKEELIKTINPSWEDLYYKLD